MTKAEIRVAYKYKRRKIAKPEKERLEDLMLIQFQRLPIEFKSSLMTYAPIEVQNEYDPFLVEEYSLLKSEHLALVFPIVDFKSETLKAYIVPEDTEFEQNIYGIDEPVGGILISPEHIDMMLVPLLAFDVNGNRVGYGKGYYDKYIELCNPNMVKIGFSFFAPVLIDDAQFFDQKLDFCITPEKIYAF